MIDLNKLHQRISALLEEARFDHSCLNCEYFNEPTELCEAHGNVRPPARVLVSGCATHCPKVPF